MKIGKVEIKNGIALAPMAGVTDITFRNICREYGCSYTVTEMISSKAVYYKDRKTCVLADISEDTGHTGIQLFGSEFDVMAYAARVMVEKYHPAIIDINMGCPVKKVTSNGEGSALMLDPDNVRKIVKGVSDAIDIPVTVKIRAGWDDEKKNAPEIAKICEYYGAAAIAVHGRTRAQLYSPPCDLDIIKEVKKAVSIPVMGNGGIMCAADAVNMFDYTGCDGIMVARGCMGNPWLFEEINAAIDGTSFSPPSITERIETAMRHVREMVTRKGPRAVAESRKVVSWYITGMEGSAKARAEANAAVTLEEIERVLQELLEKNSK